MERPQSPTDPPCKIEAIRAAGSCDLKSLQSICSRFPNFVNEPVCYSVNEYLMHVVVNSVKDDSMKCSAIQLLIDMNARLDVQESSGLTPLHYACTPPFSLQVFEKLISNNASLTIGDCDGDNAIAVLDMCKPSEKKQALRLLNCPIVGCMGQQNGVFS